MQNCETHFCPLAITNTLFPICPVEWMIERIDHHAVKDVIFEDEQLELVFNDGLVMTTEQVFRRTEGGKLAILAYEADEYLEAFFSAQMVAVTAIPAVEALDTCYLEVVLQKPGNPSEYSVIVEFFRLYSLDQNKPITYFGEVYGPQ
jgi:hypothetical protein